MTVAGPISEDSNAAARPKQRRDREEIEALASKFIAGQGSAEAATSRMPVVGAVLAGVAAFAVLIWALWPDEPPAPQSRAAATAANEVAGWQQGFEARRERKRKEIESGAAYMSRVAASDAQLMQEMSDRAEALAKRADLAARAAPPKVAATKGEPTPKAVPASVAKAPAAAPVVVASSTPTPADAAPARAQPEPVVKGSAPEAKAQPAAAPAAVASASCSIHVADLSSSGKLTYDAVARMQGARVDAAGHVFTPPVKVANGRPVVFEVMPDGCVNVVRNMR